MPNILQEILQEYGQHEKYKIKNPEKVNAILEQLVSGGGRKLQVVTDFDHTLTRYHKNGDKCETCHGILDNSPFMPVSYREAAKAACDKYYPIEIDHELTVEQKIPQMIKWYRESHELLLQSQITESQIEKMVNSSRAFLRDGAVNVLSFLNDHDVPTLIFSAGVGNILEAVLRREEAFFRNVKVVSNYITFNDSGQCASFREPLIHMFNKNETTLQGDYFQEVSGRSNALVLGDSIGDLDMGTGIHNPGAILTIGFLNVKIQERMDEFVNNFDVVLLDDQTFQFVDIVLRKIVQKPT